MIVSVIALILLSVPGLKLKKDRDSDYMNKSSTSSVMGIFVIAIFMSHVLGIMASTSFVDIVATYFYQSVISQMMVVPFFFYSGFGIIKQYNAQGRQRYLSNFPIQRFLKVYLVYILCMLFGHFIYSAATGFSTFNFTWSVLTIWNTHWFVFVILALYLVIFISLLIFKKNQNLVILSVFVLTICLVILFYSFGKGQHWYNTIIAFPLGVLFAYYKDSFDKVFLRLKTIHLFFILFGAIAIYCILTVLMKYIPILTSNIFLYLLLYYARTILFIFGILIFSLMFTFGNRILSTISKYSLFSYITQWFAFEIFKNVFPILEMNIYFYFFITLLTTITMSVILNFIFNYGFKCTLSKIRFYE